MNKLTDYILGVAIIAMLCWVAGSYFEVYEHSLDSGYEYKKANAFVMLSEIHSPRQTNNQQAKMIEIKPTNSMYSPENLKVLAHLIQAEVGNCSDETMFYTGSVVLNRVKDPAFPDNITEVVFQGAYDSQPLQYACVKNGSFFNEPTDRAWEIASDLLHEGSVLPDDVVYQAEFSQGSSVYEYIDGEYFCRK